MHTYLEYKHCRNIFTRGDFKPWVTRYFPTAKFYGCAYGNWYPVIRVSTEDYDRVELPKSYKPLNVASTIDDIPKR